jgi:Protein of unknown function (DUF1579)
MFAQPQKEHEWLQQLIGDWTMEGEADMGPDKPRSKSTGSERVRSIGGLWVVCDGQSEMPEMGSGTMVMTLGYDPAKQRYVGTWIGSMMANLWLYNGSLDSSGKILTLESEGPNFSDPTKLAKYQDIIEIVDDKTRLLRSRTPTDDGKWHEFMNMTYRRK